MVGLGFFEILIIAAIGIFGLAGVTTVAVVLLRRL